MIFQHVRLVISAIAVQIFLQAPTVWATSRIKQQSLLSDVFANPEDLVDIVGTPWMVVSENTGEPSRDTSGSVSLFNTQTTRKVAFRNLRRSRALSKNYKSPLADPTCVCRPITRLNPHGIDAYDNGDGTWEVAIVNHLMYESVEFYILDFRNNAQQQPLLSSAGCTRLREGDAHNDLSYNRDKTALAVSLWQPSFFGIKNVADGWFSTILAFLGFTEGNGSLKVMEHQGIVTTVAENLNAPNGVRFSRQDDNMIFVAEPDRVVVVDRSTGKVTTSGALKRFRYFPDNFGTDDSVSTNEDVFLGTRIDNLSGASAVLCGFGVEVPYLCDLDFSVLRYDYALDKTRKIYSSRMRGQPSVAVVKDNILYVGNYRTTTLLKVTGF